MGYPLATEFPRTRAPRQTPNPRSCLCCRGARVRRARPRARNVGLPAPRKVRSRVPPPCRIRTCPPPNRRCYDATAAIFLSRSCPREACNGAHLPRARELKRRPLGAAKVPGRRFSSRSKGVGRAGTCVRPCPIRAKSIFQHVGGKGGRGEPPAQETRRGVR